MFKALERPTGKKDKVAKRAEIEVSELDFSYPKGGKIFDQLSFNVDPQEFLTIVGPSGCGKTTILLILAKLMKETGGIIRFANSGSQGRVGIVFQEYNRVILPWLSILKNVELPLEVLGIPPEERERMARSYLEMVGLSRSENLRPAQLSGGMKQRAQIARVLAYDPSVLLMDEPFGSLDAQTKATMQQEFLKIWETKRKTVVFVTHDVDEAVFLSDRVIVIAGSPAQIVDEVTVNLPRPRSRSVLSTKEFLKIREHLWDQIMT
ncbi:MAG: ABC transporter ATP-binding protein, partial [Nitrososphaerales archaeon]